MKKVVLIGLLLMPGLASAELVYVQTAKGHQCSGDKFPITEPAEVLYNDRKCDLPLALADSLRAYTLTIPGSGTRAAITQRGCWGKTLNGSYMIITQDGGQRTAPPNAYVSASLLTGGVATVIKSQNQGTPYAKATGMCP